MTLYLKYRMGTLLVLRVLVFLFAGTIQCAAGLSVRSGEHPDFSRLVFDINPPAPWKISSDDSSPVLTIGSQDRPADLSKVFRFISRKRLKSIRRVGGSFSQYKLGVADGYHVEAFELRPGRVVVDIKSGAPIPPENPVQMPSSNDAGIASQQVVSVPPEPMAEQDRSQRAGQNRAIGPTQDDAVHMATVTQDMSKQGENGDPPKNTGARTAYPDIDVLRAQQKLVHQLGRAMTQGVVTPLSDFRGLTALGPSARVGAPRTDTGKLNEARGPDLPRPEADSRYLDHLNLEAQTVFDRELNDRILQTHRSVRGNKCLKDSDLDIASWSIDAPATKAIADMRSAMMGEFDKVDPAGLTSLIRLYITKGLGEEALVLMRGFQGVKAKNEPLLTELAQIIKTGAPENSKILAGQAGCPGASAMWALLARASIPLGEVPDEKNLNTQFANLPADLRRRIGPMLGSRLLVAGFIDEAESIERLIARAPGEDGPDVRLFQAEVDLARNRKNRARARLQEIVDANQAKAAEAILLLIETYLDGRESVPDGLISEVSARAFELRRSAMGKKLLLAELLALSRGKKQDIALEILAHESDLGMIDGPTTGAMAGKVFMSFDPADLDAAQVTRSYFRFRRLLSANAKQDQARRHISKLLIAVGLPGVALETLRPLSPRMTDKDHVLYGKIFLAMGNPKKALHSLKDVQTPAADALRVQAYSTLGKYDRAFDLAIKQDPADISDVPTIAWQAGKWRFVAEHDKTLRKRAAAYVLGDPKNAKSAGFARHLKTPRTLSLLALNDLLEKSRASRKVLKTLLDENPKP